MHDVSRRAVRVPVQERYLCISRHEYVYEIDNAEANGRRRDPAPAACTVRTRTHTHEFPSDNPSSTSPRPTLRPWPTLHAVAHARMSNPISHYFFSNPQGHRTCIIRFSTSGRCFFFARRCLGSARFFALHPLWLFGNFWRVVRPGEGEESGQGR